MKKIDGRSADLVAENIEKQKSLLPEFFQLRCNQLQAGL